MPKALWHQIAEPMCRQKLLIDLGDFENVLVGQHTKSKIQSISSQPKTEFLLFSNNKDILTKFYSKFISFCSEYKDITKSDESECYPLLIRTKLG